MLFLGATVFPFNTDSEWFWTMIQCVVVLITLLFILRQVKLQSDSHLVHSFAVFNDRWNSRMMLHARREICLKYKPGDGIVDGPLHHLCLFFEELGAFTSKKVLDPDIVWEIYSFEIEHYWKMASEGIKRFRKEENDYTFFFHFEKLYLQTRKLGEKKRAPIHERTEKDIASFRRYELESVDFFLQADSQPKTARKPPQTNKLESD
jgi:hypothetical protein